MVPIKIHNPQQDFYEQSSDDIWSAVCNAVQQVATLAEKAGHQIKAIGFDATCSLVISGVTSLGQWDVIMWMDHRAKEETAFINGLSHPVLDYVGAKVSLEMQTPKLLWLKKNKPEVWDGAQDFFDLADFLTFKATRSKKRSLCSLVCKWTYRGQSDEKGAIGWDESYFQQIGLGDLCNEGQGRGKFEKIGTQVVNPGEIIGDLDEKAAKEMGLQQWNQTKGQEKVKVACGLIDAHAGVLGLLATKDIQNIESTLCLISGTSACHMILNKKKMMIPGIWGPYFSAILGNYWLHEG